MCYVLYSSRAKECVAALESLLFLKLCEICSMDCQSSADLGMHSTAILATWCSSIDRNRPPLSLIWSCALHYYFFQQDQSTILPFYKLIEIFSQIRHRLEAAVRASDVSAHRDKSPDALPPGR